MAADDTVYDRIFAFHILYPSEQEDCLLYRREMNHTKIQRKSTGQSRRECILDRDRKNCIMDEETEDGSGRNPDGCTDKSRK